LNGLLCCKNTSTVVNRDEVMDSFRGQVQGLGIQSQAHSQSTSKILKVKVVASMTLSLVVNGGDRPAVVQ